MQIVHTLADLRRALKPATLRAFVPTMGNLHTGHLELMQMARQEVDKRATTGGMTVASIFVNRLQFGPNEDFDTYPRTFENDCALLEANGCDVVFAPSEKDLYPEPQVFKVHGDVPTRDGAGDVVALGRRRLHMPQQTLAGILQQVEHPRHLDHLDIR